MRYSKSTITGWFPLHNEKHALLTMLYYSSKGLGIVLVFFLLPDLLIDTLVLLLNPLLGLVDSNLHHPPVFGVIHRGLGDDGKVPQELKGVCLWARVCLRTRNRGSISLRLGSRASTRHVHSDCTKECPHSTILVY